MIPIYEPYFTGNEKRYVEECLDSSWISSKGEFIHRFESAFAGFTGLPHAVSLCNGTAAVHTALAALGLGPGDEVIVPSLTYIASVNPIRLTGAVPVFADSLESTWQMDPEDVRRRITPRTKAVLAVHLYGHPCDMEALAALCRENRLWLVEDCAEAIGTHYGGRHAGAFGHVAAFSFYGNKAITTGEGGMVATRDKALAERAFRFKTQGVSPDREYWHDSLGFNYRMTNICAAIGLAQLEGVGEILARKREIADWYRQGLETLPLKTHGEEVGTRHSYWMCSILLDSAGDRQPLRDRLRAAGVETRPFFHPAHILPPYASGLRLPVAESLSARGLNLPSYPALTRSQVDFICSVIQDFFGVGRKSAGEPGEAVPSLSR